MPGARGRRSLLKSVVPQTPRVPRRYRSVSKNSDEFAHEAGGSVSHTTLECAPGCCDLLLLGEGSGFVELVVGDDAVSVRVCGAEARERFPRLRGVALWHTREEHPERLARCLELRCRVATSSGRFPRRIDGRGRKNLEMSAR